MKAGGTTERQAVSRESEQKSDKIQGRNLIRWNNRRRGLGAATRTPRFSQDDT